MTEELLQKGELAKSASYKLMKTSTIVKNDALSAIADALVENADKTARVMPEMLNCHAETEC